MTRLEINKTALEHNFRTIQSWMERHQRSWCVVIKLLCGHEPTLTALLDMGIRCFAGSRLMNLETIRKINPNCETWYLRPPALSQIDDVVRYCNVSLNSELSTIRALDAEARRQDKKHNVIIMIELGELREGILPGSLIKFYESVLALENIEVWGIGANLGCLHGTVPSVEQLMQLALYKELLELKFKIRLPLISAGTSVALPMVLREVLPKNINHFRIGETLFLGNDLAGGRTLPPLRDDVFELHAEVVERKEKSLTPIGETGEVNPFPSVPLDQIKPGSRGTRALVAIGQLDCDVSGLEPVDSSTQIAGASSDLTVVNLQNTTGSPKVGGFVRFRPNYSATLSLMNSKYIEKVVVEDKKPVNNSTAGAGTTGRRRRPKKQNAPADSNNTNPSEPVTEEGRKLNNDNSA
ncbi:MAG: alanine/ornithine racemase family PLP-dependent enzyme [Verrucomicrobia bacterium]|nr:alanine/ornithine racemase family PLP-dependent enzyme [Verrucomicrobiota bacterium]MCF7707465.1 alanine/ornithine racemase family PLP-dependent enzyme [Verrucomicrobiota bacterium]